MLHQFQGGRCAFCGIDVGISGYSATCPARPQEKKSKPKAKRQTPLSLEDQFRRDTCHLQQPKARTLLPSEIIDQKIREAKEENIAWSHVYDPKAVPVTGVTTEDSEASGTRYMFIALVIFAGIVGIGGCISSQSSSNSGGLTPAEKRRVEEIHRAVNGR